MNNRLQSHVQKHMFAGLLVGNSIFIMLPASCFLIMGLLVGLQSVEEAECHRAYDCAAEVYMSSFDRSKPPEEVSDPYYACL